MLNYLLRTCLLVVILVCVQQLLLQVRVQAAEQENILIEPQCNELKRDEIEHHLSTKTPYRVVANLDDAPMQYPGCYPTRIWSIIRHGTRNPSKQNIEDAQQHLTRIKEKILNNTNTHLCAEELTRLRFWYFNVSTAEKKFLVAEGEDEMIELAERMQKRFPDLLPDDYDPSFYYFKYTATQRTLKSAQSFTTGLFGRHRIGAVMYPKALDRDPILRFYKLCKRWKIDVDKNPSTFDNVRKFSEGPEMRAAIDFIKRKTQVPDITPQEAQLIYTVCAFETAWNRRRPPSIWCNLFNRDTIKALEFAEDLEYYWNDGYGYDITHKIACPAIANMFEYIDPNSTKPNATFYFTHSGTLLKVLAHMGLYKDAQPLTHRDFKRQRYWRTSAIDAFATNVAFVLYECGEHKEPKVLTLHQERPVRIPGCPQNDDLCSLNTLRKIFAHSLDSCDFKEICYHEGNRTV